MNFFYFIAGFLSCGLLSAILRALYLRDYYKIIEHQFLLGAMYLIQFKYQAIQILHLAYEEAADINPKYKQEESLVVSKIHEKFSEFGNTWVTGIKGVLPYELQYNNWEEAIQYTERLINKNKLKK